jgi:hypothetical protein
MKIKEYIEKHRIVKTYKKLPLGTGNLREHANPNFDIEQKIITDEKRRLGLLKVRV